MIPLRSEHASWHFILQSRHRGGALLVLGREVEKSGGNEIGSYEDIEMQLGVVVAFGAIDEGLGGEALGDLMEVEVMAEEEFYDAPDAACSETLQPHCGKRTVKLTTALNLVIQLSGS